MMEIAYSRESDKDFLAMEVKLEAALAERKYGIASRIDVRRMLTEKGVDFDKDMIILGVCNPAHAKRALTVQEDVALMLPCTIVIYRRPEGTTVKLARPEAISQFFQDPELTAIAKQVEADLTTAIEEACRGGAKA